MTATLEMKPKSLYKILQSSKFVDLAKHKDYNDISDVEFSRSFEGGHFMFIKDVTVKNQVGLHSRPATFFIQKANEYKSSIWVEREERRVNAKSLLGVLSLGIMGGTNIRIIADGSDEQSAVEGLIKLVESGFEG